MQDKQQLLELEMEQGTGSTLGKEYIKAVYCHPAYLTYMQNTLCKMLGRMNHKLESKLLGEISTTPDDTTLMTESEEKLKSLLMEVKMESEKDGLKLNIQKAMIMVSGPITSWQIDEGNADIVSDFIFLGFKINADGDHNHEIKRRLLLGRIAMTNLDSILKMRDITSLTKVHIVKLQFG